VADGALRGAADGALRGDAEPEDRGAACDSERGDDRLPADGARLGALRVGCSRADGDPLDRGLAAGRLGSDRGAADGRAEGCSDGRVSGRAEGAPDEPREEPADGLDGARGSFRSLEPAAGPRLDALDRSGVASVRGASRCEGRALSPRPSVAGARAPALGVRALGRLWFGSAASLGTRALGRPAAGRSLVGALPTAGDSRPLGRSAAGARVGEAVLGVRGVVRAEPAVPSSLPDGLAEGLRAGRSAVPAPGLTARGVDALGGNRSIAGRP